MGADSRSGRKDVKRRRAPAGSSERQAAKDRYWSGEVMKRSNALDLEPGVFRFDRPRSIAASLKRSADRAGAWVICWITRWDDAQNVA
jgi:hypothetical protein